MLAVAWSDDGGLTWSLPVDLGVRGGVGVFPAIRSNGDLVVVYLLQAGQFGITASRSTDGAATWDAPVRIAPIDGGCAIRDFRAFPLPSAEVDSDRPLLGGVARLRLARCVEQRRVRGDLGRRRGVEPADRSHARPRCRPSRDRDRPGDRARRNRLHALQAGGHRRRAHGFARRSRRIGRRHGGSRRSRCLCGGCRTRRPAACSATTSRCTTRAAARWSSGCWPPSRSARAFARRSTRRAAEAVRARSGARRSSARGTPAISHGLCASAFERTTRLTFSAAVRSSSVVSPSMPVRSIAFTSMCPASHGASSSAKPVSTLTAPAGKSEVASASASSTAATGWCSCGDDHHGVAADERREHPRDEPEKRRLGRGEDRDDPGRLRDREVEVRAGDRVRAADAPAPACPPSPRTRRCDRSRPPPRRGRWTRSRDRTRAPPSSRRAGREPGRGCRRSCPTRPGAPRAPRARRRGRLSVRRGRRCAPRRRTSAPTRSAETRRRCRACTSS